MEISDKELFDFFKENQSVLDETPNTEIWETIQAKLSKPFWLSKTFLLSVLGVLILGIISVLINNSKNNPPIQKEVIVPFQIENDSVKKKTNDTIKQEEEEIVVYVTTSNPKNKIAEEQVPKITINNPSVLINIDTLKIKEQTPKVIINSSPIFNIDTLKIKNENVFWTTEIFQLEPFKQDSIFLQNKLELNKSKIYIIDSETQDTIFIDNIKRKLIKSLSTRVIIK